MRKSRKLKDEYTEVDKCGASKKVRFKSAGQAMARATEILAEPQNRKEENRAHAFRAYQCWHCGGWHLTTKPWVYRKKNVDEQGGVGGDS